MPTDLSEQLTKYLRDAHSIEEQALAQLRSAPELADDAVIAEAYTTHLAETIRQEARVRALLEARGASPSRIKDAVLTVGGKGFLLFARSQPDTPGKLQSHSYSFEALEIASYELLAYVADRAGERAVAEAARAIVVEERNMLERLSGTFDRSTAASLDGIHPDDLGEQVGKYLADAHALEQQAISLLEHGPKLGGHPDLVAVYADHLVETREHSRALEARLQVLGCAPSSLKDAALRLGALNWASFFQAHPDTPGKLAAFVFAFEHLEIAGYEQLKRVATRADDDDTVTLAARIIDDERVAATRVASCFAQAALASLDAVGVLEH